MIKKGQNTKKIIGGEGADGTTKMISPSELPKATVAWGEESDRLLCFPLYFQLSV
jgi:hypothetical protein